MKSQGLFVYIILCLGVCLCHSCGNDSDIYSSTSYKKVKYFIGTKGTKLCVNQDIINQVLSNSKRDESNMLSIIPFFDNSNSCIGVWLYTFHFPVHSYIKVDKMLLGGTNVYFTDEDKNITEKTFADYIAEYGNGFSDSTILRMKYSFLNGRVHTFDELERELYAPLDSISKWLVQVKSQN